MTVVLPVQGGIDGVGGEEHKKPKGKDLVKTLRTDISSSDKHGYRCTSRCSISQVKRVFSSSHLCLRVTGNYMDEYLSVYAE